MDEARWGCETISIKKRQIIPLAFIWTLASSCQRGDGGPWESTNIWGIHLATKSRNVWKYIKTNKLIDCLYNMHEQSLLDHFNVQIFISHPDIITIQNWFFIFYKGNTGGFISIKGCMREKFRKSATTIQWWKVTEDIYSRSVLYNCAPLVKNQILHTTPDHLKKNNNLVLSWPAAT